MASAIYNKAAAEKAGVNQFDQETCEGISKHLANWKKKEEILASRHDAQNKSLEKNTKEVEAESKKEPQQKNDEEQAWQKMINGLDDYLERTKNLTSLATIEERREWIISKHRKYIEKKELRDWFNDKSDKSEVEVYDRHGNKTVIPQSKPVSRY